EPAGRLAINNDVSCAVAQGAHCGRTINGHRERNCVNGRREFFEAVIELRGTGNANTTAWALRLVEERHVALIDELSAGIQSEAGQVDRNRGSAGVQRDAEVTACCIKRIELDS